MGGTLAEASSDASEYGGGYGALDVYAGAGDWSPAAEGPGPGRVSDSVAGDYAVAG